MILALNCGSSSLKWALFEQEASGDGARIDGGTVAGIGANGDHATHQEAVRSVLQTLSKLSKAPQAVGHRLVHGGPALLEPVRIDESVLRALREAVPLAPLHLPAALAAIDAARQALPHAPQVACFDTGFHRTLPEPARTLPLPTAWRDAGIRRYGFHGLSFEWAVSKLGLRGRAVIAHLGSGSSLCATLDGRSLDTTMGFTPEGGVMMGTRTGDLDPGVLLYLLREKGLTADQLAELLERKSGLAGVGGTSDMRALLASSDERARLAVEMFCLSVAKAAAAMSVSLGGLDTLVFTGGIGEHASPIRDHIIAALKHLKPFTVHVVTADEERMISRHTLTVLS